MLRIGRLIVGFLSSHAPIEDACVDDKTAYSDRLDEELRHLNLKCDVVFLLTDANGTVGEYICAATGGDRPKVETTNGFIVSCCALP